MAFVTGLLLIDAPASALNNLGSIPGEREDNTVGVKVIKATGERGGVVLYPYVSAQAYRYWLRTTLESRVKGWRAAPIYREEKVAYTDANPMQYWDDDLFGYMRAPSKRETAKAQRAADTSRASETETSDTITRNSPFRVSTLVSIAPVTPTSDFGTMSRHEGNPVPHEHQFYRATLKGLFSLDLHACGTFSYRNKTGFRNLDDVRLKLIQDLPDHEHLEDEKAYRLPPGQRLARVRALFDGMAQIEGGAKQTLHYTDVSPALIILAVTRGGNHIFHHAVGANRAGQPAIKADALREALAVHADALLSPVYVGWVQGYLDEERASFESFVSAYNKEAARPIQIDHPRRALQTLIDDLAKHSEWLA